MRRRSAARKRGSAALGKRWRKRRLKKANGKRALEGLLGDAGKNQAKRTAKLVEASKSYVLPSLTRRSWPRRGWVRCSTWPGGGDEEGHGPQRSHLQRLQD